MKNYWKIRIRRSLQNGLRQVKISPFYKGIMSLPYSFRVFLATISVIYGFVAILTPLPLGSLAIVIAFAVVFGIKQTRVVLMRMISLLKIHIIFAKVSNWWYRWKRR